jgi:prepilin-type processing-associated H-X9-DG protein
VIAIIAILAAILFPVFAKVREKARQTMCASNEKQIGLAILEYTQDFDEKYPLSQFGLVGGEPPANYDWTYAVNPYVQNGTHNAGWQGAMNSQVWTCPSFPAEPGDGIVEYAQFRPLYDVITEINNKLAPPGTGGGAVALNDINKPADKIMIFEGKVDGNCWGWPADLGFNVDEWNWANGGQTPKGAHTDIADQYPSDNMSTAQGWPSCWNWPKDYVPTYRHNSMGNFLFCDGHVKAMHVGSVSFADNIYNWPSRYETLEGSGAVY